MVKKIVPFDGGALESKPFGAYQIFIDYKTGAPPLQHDRYRLAA